MKKFLFKLSIYIIVMLIITLTINGLYISANPETDEGTGKFENMPDKIQICNFGSSHGNNDFNYENAKNKFSCFNFALGSQSLDYDYRILQYYSNCIQENAIIFILASYFSFAGIDETETADFPSMNRRYYKILPKDMIKQYDFKTNLYINYFPGLIADMGLLKIIPAFANILQKREQKEKERKASDIEDIKATGQERYLYHMRHNKYDSDGKIIFNQDKINTMYKMIYFCREKNFIPILVTTPFLTEYYSHFWDNKDFITKFYAIINKIVNDTGVKYYDYSRDSRFSHNYELFRDTDHLNPEGAKKFTDIIINDVMNDLKQ